MTTISSIGSLGSVLPTQGSSQAQRGKSPYESAADVLGMSADDVKTAVEGGQSLMDLAEQQGVSSDDLLSALKDGAPAELQGSDQLDEIVTEIANQTGSLEPKGPGGPGGAGGPGGPPPGPPPSGVMSGNLTSTQSTTVDTLSSLLDMDSDDLTSAIKDGSLTNLLQSAGVDLTDLSSALETALSGSTTGFQVDVRA